MRAIATLAIGTPLARRIAHERGARWHVAARFAHTLWLRDAGDALCALTTHHNPGAHRAVVAELPRWAKGALVTAAGRALAHGGTAVRWGADAEWDPRPRSLRLPAQDRRNAVTRLAGALCEAAMPDAGGFWDWLASRWDEARSAIRQRDAVALVPFCRELIGRGPGLSPAGDDVTQGLCLTLHCDADAGRGFVSELRRVVTPCLARTTPLGSQCIREALDGMAFGALKALLNELPEVRPVSVRALLSTGATSGTACALGVLLALESGVAPRTARTLDESCRQLPA